VSVPLSEYWEHSPVSEGVGEYQMKNRDFDLKSPNDAANKINKKKKRCK
jgi:hypothetical protein